MYVAWNPERISHSMILFFLCRFESAAAAAAARVQPFISMYEQKIYILFARALCTVYCAVLVKLQTSLARSLRFASVAIFFCCWFLFSYSFATWRIIDQKFTFITHSWNICNFCEACSWLLSACLNSVCVYVWRGFVTCAQISDFAVIGDAFSRLWFLWNTLIRFFFVNIFVHSIIFFIFFIAVFLLYNNSKRRKKKLLRTGALKMHRKHFKMKSEKR